MKLVIFFGPYAVGKMTVGQELAEITGLKLFYNHTTLDIVAELFENYPEERVKLLDIFRQEVFKAYLRTDEYGLIFTCIINFTKNNDWEYVEKIEEMFKEAGAEVYFVELEADYETRIERNKTFNRIMNRMSKRDIVKSEAKLREIEARCKLNSDEGQITKENYMRLDNTHVLADHAAEQIKERFAL